MILIRILIVYRTTRHADRSSQKVNRFVYLKPLLYLYRYINRYIYIRITTFRSYYITCNSVKFIRVSEKNNILFSIMAVLKKLPTYIKILVFYLLRYGRYIYRFYIVYLYIHKIMCKYN